MIDHLEKEILEFSHLWDVECLIGLADLLNETSIRFVPDTIRRYIANQSPPGLRHRIRKLVDGLNIQESNNYSRMEMAIRIRTCVETIRLCRQVSTVELVWTGPLPEGCSARRTEQVLVDFIDASEKELWIASYAFFEFEELIVALERARDRGVVVHLILEIAAEGRRGGVPKSKIDSLFGKMQLSLYSWASDRRGNEFSCAKGVMHAKFVLSDRRSLLITSANLTDTAMVANMELGVSVHGGDAPQKLAVLLERLLTNGILQQNSIRKNHEQL